MFQAGTGPCNGWGTCVNSTINPLRLLCQCGAGRSGASAFFDSRVERLPDGTYLSLTCGESDVGTYVAWSIVAAIGLIRVRQLVPVFVQFFTKYRREKEKGIYGGFWNDFALKVSTWDLFIVTTFWWILVAGQLSRMTLGTDPLVTILLPLVVLAFNLTQYWITQREFEIFVRATMNPKYARQATRFRRIVKLSNLTGYFIVNGGATFWTLSLDKSRGPVDNFEYLAIVLRNASTIIWGITDLAATYMVQRQLLQTLKMHSSDQNSKDAVSTNAAAETRPASSKQTSPTKTSSKLNMYAHSDLDTKTQEVIKRMQVEVKSLMVFIVTATLMYGTFLIPQLYPFQTYSIAFVIGTGALRHCGKAFQIQPNKDGAVANNGGGDAPSSGGSKDGTIVAAVSPTNQSQHSAPASSKV